MLVDRWALTLAGPAPSGQSARLRCRSLVDSWRRSSTVAGMEDVSRESPDLPESPTRSAGDNDPADADRQSWMDNAFYAVILLAMLVLGAYGVWQVVRVVTGR